MREILRGLCDKARERGASFADARVYEADHTGITRQDGRADKLDQGSTSGLGVRVLKDYAWGFACASDFNGDSAMEALNAAIAMADASSARSEEAMVAEVEGIEDTVAARFEIDPRGVGFERQMAALARRTTPAVRSFA